MVGTISEEFNASTSNNVMCEDAISEEFVIMNNAATNNVIDLTANINIDNL